MSQYDKYGIVFSLVGSAAIGLVSAAFPDTTGNWAIFIATLIFWNMAGVHIVLRLLGIDG